ncbi:MAG: DEAD/DEAH box helicase [Erysipelotrichia bacterium]|nr:DEAD/DEAH box helicase [Erysipelotrichia bacterium]
MNKYSDYQLKEQTKKFIALNKFVTPTQIQREVIPHALKGKDIIGISATGTGKTHAFLIPILERINVEEDKVQAVISAPTRELALQLYTRALDMNKACKGLRIKLITGGVDKQRMSEQLKVQPHIVIGTPGRMKDMFLNETTLRLDSASVFVVDEADMTLEFGFLEDIDAICSRMGSHLQMMSFSATIPEGLKPFLKKYMNNPIIVKVEDDLKFKPKIEHVLVPCKHLSYEEELLAVLKGFTPYVCLIFANTRSECSQVAKTLRENGYGVLELHGDLTSRARKSAMKSLTNLKESYVVASDIAARGIDIDGVSHVISLGFPNEIDFYIHRSGRTGRAGKDGICYALYKKEDENIIRQLQVKGIGFKHREIKNGEWKELTPIFERKRKKEDPLEKEIAKMVNNKKKKVKPGYKKKRKEEVDKLKRKAKRSLIQSEIKAQAKERAKERQRKKKESE